MTTAVIIHHGDANTEEEASTCRAVLKLVEPVAASFDD